MRYLLLATVFLFSTVYADASAQLVNLLQNLRTYRAEFVQHTYAGNRRQAIQKSTGNMLLMRPGYFRWQVTSPNHQIIVTNGKRVQIYDQDLMQVTDQSLQQKGSGITPASFLSNSAKVLSQRFNISSVGASQFVLKPKAGSGSFSQITLVFKGPLLTDMKLVNNLGQLNDYVFSNIQLNYPVRPNAFKLFLPKGIDVIKG